MAFNYYILMIHKVCNLMPLEKITLNHLLYSACPSATFTIFAIFLLNRVKKLYLLI